MKIAVDLSWLGPTGIGRMASEILQRSPDRIRVDGIRQGLANAHPLTPLSLSYHISRSQPDVFWSPGFMPPAIKAGVPSAVTVHDLTHLHYYGKKHKFYYDNLILPMLRNVDVVFTVSDFTKNEIREWSGLPDDRVIRIYNGLDAGFRCDGSAFDLGRPYILYVGNRRPYKNVTGLMRAFAQAGLAKNGYVLALTGNKDEELASLSAKLNISDAVHYLGFVPEAELPSLYRGAHAVAFVSIYEGFGLPILEAMGCGTPVLTSTKSSMPEVAGGAAVLVDPLDDDQISEGLAQLCFDQGLRRECRQAGLSRAQDFSWDHAATEYWQVLGALR
jgi:glycosyltransferase involved in cell wall biosynthesis